MFWFIIAHVFSTLLDYVGHDGRSHDQEALWPIKQKEPPSRLESSLSYSILR